MIVVFVILVANIQLASATSCFCTSRDFVIPVSIGNKQNNETLKIFLKHKCFTGRVQGDLFCPENQSFCLDLKSLQSTPCGDTTEGNSSGFSHNHSEEQVTANYEDENMYQKRFLVQPMWNMWSSWQECIATRCGDYGITRRTRECFPISASQACVGDKYELSSCWKNCSQQSDLSSHWSSWSAWSSCGYWCVSSMSNRTRVCMAPDNSSCIGNEIEEKPCKADGEWSQWSAWSSCSLNYTASLDGLTHRLRKCDNPAPHCGGTQCYGTSWEISTCAKVYGWTEWSNWSSCIKTAGMDLNIRNRTCSNDEDSHCYGKDIEHKLCNPKTYTIWTSWGVCSTTCGKGVQTRKGYCVTVEKTTDSLQPEFNSFCDLEVKHCIQRWCTGSTLPPWSEWSSWSHCYPPCYTGRSKRTRTCLDTVGCNGTDVQYTNCSPSLCNIDGHWSPWEEWSECTIVQGYNLVERHRQCTHPPPKNSGKNCSGDSFDINSCQYESIWEAWTKFGGCYKTENEGNTTGLQYRNRTCQKGVNKSPCNGSYEDWQSCTLQGKWSRWGNWSACSQTCGQGFKHRFRSCINASDLECAGSRLENTACVEVQNCPIDGSFTKWTAWSQCHVTCGGGPISRNRYCDNPRPQYGGKNCEGPLTEASVCNTQSCPVDGHWTDWTEWKPCSVTCGNGTKVRERTCSNPLPRYGGKSCEGHGTDTDKCNEAICSVDGGWRSWEAWTQCNCQNIHIRNRYCNNPKPTANGSYCVGEATQTKSCIADPSLKCPINGQWNNWSEWGSVCSVTCGKGTVSRTRECSNPAPLYGGAPCPGEHSDNKGCDTIICPVDGGWSSWSAWTHCDVTCEYGTQSRNRTCNMPRPANGGRDCQGLRLDTKVCLLKGCPLDGAWSEWQFWSSWDVTCGRGSRFRLRLCDNPAPNFGGHSCPGDRNDFDSKDLVNCPIDGGWSEWSEWFGCTATCGRGSNTRYRACDNPKAAYHGTPCPPQDFKETVLCNLGACPVSVTTASTFGVMSTIDASTAINKAWSDWTAWSKCSVTCYIGTRSRTRTCLKPDGNDCVGDTHKAESCVERPSCVVDGGWSEWSPWFGCSLTCGPGTDTRYRACNNPTPENGGRYCQGSFSDHSSCNLRLCPVDGNWSEWEAWGVCTATCSNGTIVRTRNCSNPAPMHNGKRCTGNKTDVRDCFQKPCPIDGQWSSWSPWFGCSTTCAPGTNHHYRACDNPKPEHGGNYCHGSYSETIRCNDGPCPVDGYWSDWGAWGFCSVTCSYGTSVRSRICDNPAPLNGGEECTGNMTEMRSCFEVPCPIDGDWAGWGAWGGCSATCSNGTSQRKRSCSKPYPQYGGKPCFGHVLDVRECNLGPCIVDGGWSDWGQWRSCSVTCSNGTSVRIRTCDNPLPQNGGKLCAGNFTEVNGCFQGPCPVNGNWGSWTPWSRCIGDCSTANKQRYRNCDNPMPDYGGETCEGSPFEMISCKPSSCATRALTRAASAKDDRDIAPYWSPWSYGECTMTCGPGTTRRTRYCNFGKDEDCQGPADEIVACNKETCPDWISLYQVEPCSVTCGEGIIQLRRECSTGNSSDCDGSEFIEIPCVLNECI